MSNDELLADRLHSVAIHLLRRARRADVATVISPAELSALSVIVFGGPLTLGELAAAEQVRPPSMTRIVKKLVGEELITRAPDQADRRIARLRATTKGDRLIMQGRSARVGLLAKMLRGLGTDERVTLEAASEILERVLAVPSRERGTIRGSG
jgi:DNA-binding MarR family transcriptional regulator